MSDDFEACPECGSLLEHSGRCLRCEQEASDRATLRLFAVAGVVGTVVFFGAVVLAFGLLTYLK